MSFILNLLLFIVILGFIVLVHEFGHFIFAKMNGVYVYEFAIGMGPKLFSKKSKETEYSIRAVPIGGFCQLAGEDVGEDDLQKVPKKRRLQSKTAFQRFLIMFFGAGNNFISAILIIFIIGLFFGSTSMKPVITTAEKGYPAYEAGILANKSKAQKLLLTHFWPEEDKKLYLEEAKQNFENVEVAEEGKKLILIK